MYPVEMEPDVMPLEEFLVNGLPLLDEDIKKRIDNASSNGNVLRYVCLIEGSRYLIFFLNIQLVLQLDIE